MKKFRMMIPLDLLIVLVWIFVSSAVAILPIFDYTVIRVILGFPSVLFIPGYVFVMVLYPSKHELCNIDRVTLSLGLSIAIISIIGLLLNFTYGLGIIPMLLALCIYVVILVIFATYRRNILSENDRFSILSHKTSAKYSDNQYGDNKYSNNRRKIDISSILIIFLLVVLVSLIYFVMIVPKIGERFTEFYVLNSSDRSDNYKTNLRLNTTYNYLVGITNYEYAPTNYTLKTTFEGYSLTTYNLSLRHNERLESKINFTPNKEGTNMKFELLLFKNDNLSEPYRELYLWVNVTR